jgi:acetyl/propionyl-CoA carboxylase alpha subunit
MRSGEQAAVGADLLAFLDAMKLEKALLRDMTGEVEPLALLPHCGRNG